MGRAPEPLRRARKASLDGYSPIVDKIDHRVKSLRMLIPLSPKL